MSAVMAVQSVCLWCSLGETDRQCAPVLFPSTDDLVEFEQRLAETRALVESVSGRVGPPRPRRSRGHPVVSSSREARRRPSGDAPSSSFAAVPPPPPPLLPPSFVPVGAEPVQSENAPESESALRNVADSA